MVLAMLVLILNLLYIVGLIALGIALLRLLRRML